MKVTLKWQATPGGPIDELHYPDVVILKIAGSEVALGTRKEDGGLVIYYSHDTRKVQSLEVKDAEAWAGDPGTLGTGGE